jgi:hypothetical protein
MSGSGRILYRISKWFVQEKGRLLLLLSFLLVGTLAFQAGFLNGSMIATKPLVIERPDISGCPGGEVAGASSESTALESAESKTSPTSLATSDIMKCAFVGSKNSTLYHLPHCAVAKRIKPENIVCFTSEADAKDKGYKAGCIK